MPSFRFALRFVVGFLLTPFVAGLSTFVLYHVLWTAGVPLIGQSDHVVQFAVGLGIASVYVAVPVTCGAALPLFVWMANHGALSIGSTLRAGAFLGVSWFAALVIAIPLIDIFNGTMAADVQRMWSRQHGVGLLIFLLFIAAVGMLTAAVFWLSAIRGSELEPQRFVGLRDLL